MRSELPRRNRQWHHRRGHEFPAAEPRRDLDNKDRCDRAEKQVEEFWSAEDGRTSNSSAV